MISTELNPYTKFLYNKNNTPTTDWQVAVEQGVNCQWLVHRFYWEEFGQELPRGLWSKEFFEDNGEFFIDHKSGLLVKGDVIVVSRGDNPDPKKFHLAVSVESQDIKDKNNTGHVIHATSFEPKVAEWETRRLLERYRLRAVKRMKPDLFDIVIKPHI